jgi:hypothetical protein
MPKDRYLLTFYQVKDSANEAWANEKTFFKNQLLDHRGKLCVEPIYNKGAITNPALPDYVSGLPGNYIVISQFPSQTELDLFLKADFFSNERVLPDGIELSEIASAKLFKPMPFMPTAPVIGSIEHAKEPGFILLNGISMQSMLNPMTPIRMGRYMSANMSNLKNNGVKMLEAFEITQRVKGVYDFDMLFLTEWPSMEIYKQIHDDRNFIDLAKKTRNRAFKAFSEDLGIIQLP